MRLCAFLGSVGVLSCEVALLFSPCLPGGSPQAYKLPLGPRPSADLGPDTQGSSAWGWGRAGPPCRGVSCLWAGAARAGPCVLTPGFQRLFSVVPPGQPPPAAPWGAGHPLGVRAWYFITPGLRHRHLSGGATLSGRTGRDPAGVQGIFQFLPLPLPKLPK